MINHLENTPADSIVNLNVELANRTFDITGVAMIGVDFQAVNKEKHPLLLAYEAYVISIIIPPGSKTSTYLQVPQNIIPTTHMDMGKI